MDFSNVKEIFERNVDDQDVGLFFRLLTDLPIVEPKNLESLKFKEMNEAKNVF